MLWLKTGEACEVIRASAFRVAKQRGGQIGVFGGSRLAANRDQRFRQNPGTEKLIDRRTRRKLENRAWRLNFGNCPIHMNRWQKRIRAGGLLQPCMHPT